jgi:hypothetical protein
MNMEILSFGGGRRMRECVRLLESVTNGLSGRLILLPIPTTRDNIYINGTDLALGSVAPLLTRESTLVGYNIPKEIILAAGEASAAVYDAGSDETFLMENAIISARGAVGYVLTNFTRDIADMKIGLVGYGRIGRALLRYLLCLGSEPILYTRRQEIAIELGASGVDCRVLGEDSDLRGLDILINTSPTAQIDPDELDPKTQIIDLASGKPFPSSDRLTKLASIPDAMYPITAGRLYAEGVLRFFDMEVSL